MVARGRPELRWLCRRPPKTRDRARAALHERFRGQRGGWVRAEIGLRHAEPERVVERVDALVLTTLHAERASAEDESRVPLATVPGLRDLGHHGDHRVVEEIVTHRVGLR